MYLRLILCLVIFGAFVHRAFPHDIYSGVYSNGRLCCGGDPVTGDCGPTQWSLRDGQYFIRSREGKWIHVPQDQITFLPVPGDEKYANIDHLAHLCYRLPNSTDKAEDLLSGEGEQIHLYCAFIPPGGV